MRWAGTPDPWDKPARRLPKAALKQRAEKHQAEAEAAAAAGDAAAGRAALAALALTQRDLELWRAVIATCERLRAMTSDEVDLDERIRPHYYAAAAARELKDWPLAVLHAAWIDALAGAAESAEVREVATAAVVDARKKVGLKAFGELLAAALEALPEDLRQHVRTQEHLHPTVRADGS